MQWKIGDSSDATDDIETHSDCIDHDTLYNLLLSNGIQFIKLPSSNCKTWVDKIWRKRGSTAGQVHWSLPCCVLQASFLVHQLLHKKICGFSLVFTSFWVSGNLERKVINNFVVLDLTLSGTTGKFPQKGTYHAHHLVTATLDSGQISGEIFFAIPQWGAAGNFLLA